MKKKASLTRRIFWAYMILIIIILAIVAVITAVVEKNDMNDQIDQSIREKAIIISEEPLVQDAFVEEEVSAETMEFLDNAISKDASVDYIVLADTDSVRLYHPNHDLIGLHFQGGDEGPALEGSDIYITNGVGTREYQRRCFVSIKDDRGEVLGFIMVSRYVKTIRNLIWHQTSQLVLLFLIAVVVSSLMATLLSKAIRKQLLGYEPSQISRMFLQREEVLDGLTEGIILVNDQGVCEYANEAAGTIFGGRESEKIQPFIDEYVKDRIADKAPVLQQTIRRGDTTLLMDVLPVWNKDQYAGSLVEINDKTESIKMAAQLTGVDQIVGALRASTHETKNRMHVILGLLQIGELDEAIDFIQSSAGYDEESDHIRALIENNTLAALLIGKRNRAKELGIDLKVRKDSGIGSTSNYLSSADLVTIVGNLIENSFDAILESDSEVREISLYIKETEDMLVISCDDTGCGMTQEQIGSLMKGGYTTKGENHGIGTGLIRNIINGSNGTMDIESEPGEGTSITITLYKKEV